jgi:hypothetical protein
LQRPVDQAWDPDLSDQRWSTFLKNHAKAILDVDPEVRIPASIGGGCVGARKIGAGDLHHEYSLAISPASA